jgi:uncharacterized protein YqeY
MTTLKERLRTDLTAGMRARDELRTGTLRMALTAITTEEVSGAEARQLSDDEVVAVLTREAKKRREAAEAYDVAGRTELAARERAEGEVLADYLPQQLGADELAGLIEAAVAAAAAEGQSGPRAMGAVMRRLQPETAGRADGAALAAAVKERLTQV